MGSSRVGGIVVGSSSVVVAVAVAWRSPVQSVLLHREQTECGSVCRLRSLTRGDCHTHGTCSVLPSLEQEEEELPEAVQRDMEIPMEG